MKINDVALMAEMNTEKEIKIMAKEMGMSDSEIKKELG
jgi:hypothetical protein